MVNDWLILIYYAVIIGISLWAGPYFLYRRSYLSRVARSKEISKSPDIIIPPEILALIRRFDPSIEIRIADNAGDIPETAIFRRHPAYIVISRFALGETTSDNIRFETKHLLAIVAHELGHIVQAKRSTWLLEICASGMACAWISFLLALVRSNWIGFLWAILAFVFITNVLNLVSRLDEYRADAFAITDGFIPIADYSEALKVLELHISIMYKKSMDRLKLMKKALISILGTGHPSVEQRIRRIQILYGEQVEGHL
jgi:hypothetical protein